MILKNAILLKYIDKTGKFSNYMKKLRLGIIQSFIIVISLLFGVYLIWDYQQSLSNARKSAQTLFLQISRNIKADLEKIKDASDAILTTTKASYDAGIIDFGAPKMVNAVFMPRMKVYPFITSINFGDSLGNGYLILRAGDAWTERTQKDSWMNRMKISAEKDKVTWYKLDHRGEVIFTEKKLDDYDPRVRPWYENAVNSEGISWSDPYIFRTTQDIGITASMVIGKRYGIEGVLGVDIMLKDLSNAIAGLVKENPEIKVRIVGYDGSVLACSDIKHFHSCLKERTNLPKTNECGYEILDVAMKTADAQKKPLVDFSFDGHRFVSASERIRLSAVREMSVIITMPERAMLKDFYRAAAWKIIVFLAILILASGWYVWKYLIPLKKLSIEMKKMGSGESAGALTIASRNDEIGDVASEFEKMRSAIEKHQGQMLKSSKELCTLNDRLNALWETTRMADADYGTLCSHVLGEIMSMSHSKYGFYAIMSEDEKVMNIYAWSENVMSDCSMHAEKLAFPIANAGLWAEAVINKQPLIVNSYADETRKSKKGLPDGHIAINRLLVVPVVREGQTVAVAIVANKENDYTKEDTKQLDAFLSSVQVVIDRKKAYESLEESERKYRRISGEFNALLDAVPDSITLYDRQLKVVWANNSAAKAVGQNLPDITGSYCGDMWLKRGSVCDLCPTSRSFQYKESANEVVTSREGRVWDVRTIPIFDGGGEVVNVMEVCRDVTEHRRLEDQLRHAQKMEAVGQLTGGIAHDFNNILSAIIGYGHLLKIKAEDVIGEEEINEMLKAADRAAKLTQSLLAFSRKQVMDIKPVDLNDIVRNMFRLILRTLGEEVELRTDLSSEEIIVQADSAQIEQVLLNLAMNAKDAMPDRGMLKIETGFFNIDEHFVKSHSYGKPGRYAIMTVSDTGIGMDADTKAKIFEPFFTTKEVGKGTGLGLAMVYGIIKQHSGYINIYSEQGKGTTFRIYLPLAEKTGKSSLPEKDSLTREIPQGTETVLLTEDDESLRRLLSTVLQKSGYSVIEAENGEEAVARFAENKDSVSLLILDVIMPKKNGREAFEDIKKIRPDIKAIFVSGYTADVIHKKGILEEGIDFIMKPVEPGELLHKVRSVLDREN